MASAARRRLAPHPGSRARSGDGRRTAIEVELQPKSHERLALIFGGYRGLIQAGQLSDVAYVCDRRDVSALVRRQADAGLIGDKVRVGPLDKLINATRQRAEARVASARTQPHHRYADRWTGDVASGAGD